MIYHHLGIPGNWCRNNGKSCLLHLGNNLGRYGTSIYGTSLQCRRGHLLTNLDKLDFLHQWFTQVIFIKSLVQLGAMLFTIVSQRVGAGADYRLGVGKFFRLINALPEVPGNDRLGASNVL